MPILSERTILPAGSLKPVKMDLYQKAVPIKNKKPTLVKRNHTKATIRSKEESFCKRASNQELINSLANDLREINNEPIEVRCREEFTRDTSYNEIMKAFPIKKRRCRSTNKKYKKLGFKSLMFI